MEDARKGSELTICRLLKQDGYAKTNAEARTFMASKGNAWLKSYLRSKTIDELYPPENGAPVGMLLDKMSSAASISASFVDGYVVPDFPLLCLKKGNYSHVPIMLGNTSEELKLFIPFFMSDPSALCMALLEFDPENPDFDLRDFLREL